MQALSPYWPMCERLAITTRDLLATHSRLYDVQSQQEYPYNRRMDYGGSMSNPESNNTHISPYSNNINNYHQPHINYHQQQKTNNYHQQHIQSYYHQQHPQHLQPSPQQSQQPQQSQPKQLFDSTLVDFNSCEFLYDSGVFSQIVFDDSAFNNPSDIKYLPSQNDQYSMVLNTSAYNQPQQQTSNNTTTWRI